MKKNWREDYQTKLCSAAEAAKRINSGDSIFAAGFSAMPHEFTEALAERRDELQNVGYFGCLAPYCFKIMNGEFKGHINYHTIFSGPYERAKATEGNISQLSVHLGEFDRFLTERVRPKVLAVNVSEPDKHGYMTFGACGGMGMDTARQLAKTIIVTVQKSQPKVPGEFNVIHVNEVDAIIETDVLIPTLPNAPIADVDQQIAAHVVPLVEDGSTIQVGIGGVPGAIALGLKDKKDLGIHTELLTDEMYQLVKTGAVTGARKNIYPRKIVFGFACGSSDLLEFLDDNPECINRPVSETVDAHLCGQNDRFVSINTCLMVSITGQVAAEGVNFTQISGTGGQLDLVRAARNSKGGKSVIALASTRELKSGKRISAICLSLPPGTPVTTPRTDVEYIATEYGVVNLRYKSNQERAAALISIAHPDFREELQAGVLRETRLSLTENDLPI
jgi:4-hydroxybutyrate CoA-transferase